MSIDIIVIGRIVLSLISVVTIFLLIYARVSNRSSNQFFVMMIIFWVGVLTVSIRPEILNSILDDVGLVNRAQFLLSISIIIIIYLLINQVRKGKNISENLASVIRNIALENFSKEIKSKKIDMVIIIVAKNESKTIGDVIDKINALNLKFSYEILVVNDGSNDRTEEIAKSKNALVITHHVNLGIGGATKTGYLACRYLNPKYVISLDADGQHNPIYIPEIISKLKESDLVYGSRFAKESKYQTNVIRFAGNQFYTKLVNGLGKINITDVTSGFRGIRYNKIDSVYFIAETNFAIEFALRAAKNHLQIDEISTISKERDTGKSQFFKIERFIVYNFNAFIQIFNALFRKPKKYEIEIDRKRA